MATRIQLRRGTAALWTAANSILAAGEPAVETDTGKLKIGDGTSAWSALPYILDIADLVSSPELRAASVAAVQEAITDGDLDVGGVDSVNGQTGPVTITAASLGAAPQEYVDTNLAPASVVGTITGLHDDPLSLGFVAGHTLLLVGSAQTWGSANEAKYVRVLSAGWISKIGLQVEVSSGNISVSAHRRSGSGRDAAPGIRAATSGAVPCPPVGLQWVNLDAPLYAELGDYVALSCDNTTASFYCTAAATSRAIFQPMFYGQPNGHPLPTAPSGLFGTGSKVPMLIAQP